MEYYGALHYQCSFRKIIRHLTLILTYFCLVTLKLQPGNWEVRREEMMMRQRRDQEPVLLWQCALLVGYLKLSTMVGTFKYFLNIMRHMCRIDSNIIFKCLKLTKGHLISKGLFKVFICTKKQIKVFLFLSNQKK